jgi:hypothetical protein
VAGIEASEKFLVDYFDKKGMTYDEMIEEIIVKNCDKASSLGFGDYPEEEVKKMSSERKTSFFNKLFGIK